MNIYIDESGSINCHNANHSPYFIISLVCVKNKEGLQKAYKRFVSSNFDRLKELDADRLDPSGRVIREGGKMFDGEKFKELKGAMFDPPMKKKFLTFFARKPHFEVNFIRLFNSRISTRFCANTARSFNYVLLLALKSFISKGILPNENFVLQLDERNERTETKYFLENYLNTQLHLEGTCDGTFQVIYFDSAENHLVQIADVFSNCFYSDQMTHNYGEEFQLLKEKGIFRRTFDFPLSPLF